MAVLIKFFIRTTLSVAETVSLDVRCFWAVPVAPRARWEDEDMVRFQGRGFRREERLRRLWRGELALGCSGTG